jgi:hypothetical protein
MQYFESVAVLIVHVIFLDSSKEQIGLLSGYNLEAPTITAEKPTGFASDWALIALEDQYIKPNTIQLDGTNKLIPITGYLPTKELTAGKVWVCTSRGPQLGALVQNPTVMGMGGSVFETRGIRLENELSKYMSFSRRCVMAYFAQLMATQDLGLSAMASFAV